MNPSAVPLISRAAIQRRLKVLARHITAHYREKPLTVVGLLDGSVFFLADLFRQLPPPTRMECWRVQSYQGKASTGKLRGLENCAGNFHGRHLLLIDDILDTGLTLSATEKHALKLGAVSVEICVLLRKSRSRLAPIHARWAGFDIADEFVVGYGLDFNGKYRGLPAIHVMDE